MGSRRESVWGGWRCCDCRRPAALWAMNGSRRCASHLGWCGSSAGGCWASDVTPGCVRCPAHAGGGTFCAPAAASEAVWVMWCASRRRSPSLTRGLSRVGQRCRPNRLIWREVVHTKWARPHCRWHDGATAVKQRYKPRTEAMGMRALLDGRRHGMPHRERHTPPRPTTPHRAPPSPPRRATNRAHQIVSNRGDEMSRHPAATHRPATANPTTRRHATRVRLRKV